ncbi:hypothetical protein DL93DRAFT_2086498 [Clavulina sp. PMI_390]|nr:hypothetical protein DL93DRAFT_2086498 [Clavulina sp. PMI_390]
MQLKHLYKIGFIISFALSIQAAYAAGVPPMTSIHLCRFECDCPDGTSTPAICDSAQGAKLCISRTIC